ncbi:unnamed protein product [Lactuca virosa]|uniref:Uncharacterized protein n=1 Tax=Lactuca virosa TaxID=75947 RepID=A0AAU9PUH9_9ASTR|nr:unnamed protein product [Lactuca virosa]
MGKEFRITDFDVSGGDDDDRVLEWEVGLPNVDDLSSLSQFNDIGGDGIDFQHHARSSPDDDREEEMVVEGDETVDLTPDGSDSRKLWRVDSGDDHSSTKSLKRICLVWTPQLHSDNNATTSTRFRT